MTLARFGHEYSIARETGHGVMKHHRFLPSGTPEVMTSVDDLARTGERPKVADHRLMQLASTVRSRAVAIVGT
ncbi:hypothetical protein PQQ52_19165 [Paraburkholderia sediminicola]|uniref:hypothetical protein n=1 Tax=Paraburkholderia sediminicola TaxID=458836 RepID=UPI0038B8D5C2